MNKQIRLVVGFPAGVFLILTMLACWVMITNQEVLGIFLFPVAVGGMLPGHLLIAWSLGLKKVKAK